MISVSEYCKDNILVIPEALSPEVVVLPYFLSAGRHVVEDIPDEVAKVTALFPKVSIHIAPYLGTAPDLPETLVNLAAK